MGFLGILMGCRFLVCVKGDEDLGVWKGVCVCVCVCFDENLDSEENLNLDLRRTEFSENTGYRS